MYIGTVKLSAEWEKVEDLIKDQVAGRARLLLTILKHTNSKGKVLALSDYVIVPRSRQN